jgi:pimeloyl-ACP methyl ester carboxylesterase
MRHEATIGNQHYVYWLYHPHATKTIVMIHGFTGNHKGFQYIIPLLSDFRCVVLDLPGFGESSLPGREDWTIDSIARLANNFVRSLGLKEPPLIFGHSMGGLVVSSMLHQAPTLYHQRGVLLSPVPTAIRSNDSRRVGAILGALQYGLGYRLPKAGEKIVKSKTIAKVATRLIMTTNDRQLRKAIHSHHFDNLNYISSIEFYSKLHHDINRQGSIDFAASLRTRELLLILGSNDNVAPMKEQEKFIRAIRPLEIHIIPGVGHLAHYEEPARVANTTKQFLG